MKLTFKSLRITSIVAGVGLFAIAFHSSPTLPQFNFQNTITCLIFSAIAFIGIRLVPPKSIDLLLGFQHPLSFSFLLPYLLSKEWWRKDQLLSCTLCAAYVLLTYSASHTGVSFRLPPGFRDRVCRILLLFLSSLYLLHTSYFTILKHYKFLTSGFDLAIFHNAILNASRGTLFQVWCANKLSFFTMHFEPILSLIVPFYLIWPHVETLLIFQAAILALATIPLYAFAKLKLHSPRLALLVVVVYLFHPGLHVAQFYDFHEMSFLPILLFSMFYFHQKRRILPFFLATILCLGIKEDFGIYLFFIFLFLGLTDGWKPHVLFGVSLCVAYGWFANWVICTLGGDPHRLFPSYYYQLQSSPKDGVLAMLLNAIADPEKTFNIIFNQDKLLYLIQLFLPLAFLPLFRPKNLVLFIFPLGLTLLASSPALYTMNFQYTLYFIAPAIVGVVYSFSYQSRKHTSAGIVAALLFASFTMSYQYGVIFNQRYVIWQRNNYQGWLRLSSEEYAEYMELHKLVENIPADAEGVLCAGELCAQLEHVYHFSQIEDKFPQSAYEANYVLMGKNPEIPGGQRAEDPVWKSAGLSIAHETEHFALYRRFLN